MEKYQWKGPLIDQRNIVKFVNAVEKKKAFVPNPDKIFRHIVSEIGELDAAMYEVDKLDKEVLEDSVISSEGLKKLFSKKIGEELLDIIFLCCYMADVYGLDLNNIAPGRMAAIAKQYEVDLPEPVSKKVRNIWE